MGEFDKANKLLNAFKGANYVHGLGVLEQAGALAAPLGTKAVLIADTFSGSEGFVATIKESLTNAGVEVLAQIDGAQPNAPLEDLSRITDAVVAASPDVIISFGGGSTIDAAKAAEVLRTLGGDINDYFGVGNVTEKLQETGKSLTPHLAIETAASSGAHLTKYSNITDVSSGQKKLIVDEAIVPAKALFDYEVTSGCPRSLTADGALDGIAHSLEVMYSAAGKDSYEKTAEIAEETIRLVVKYLPKVLEDPQNGEGREALGLATDLGGYAIMVGGTNGGHLTSFSLVDVLTHGRACAMMNPYYTVFFAPNIPAPLRVVAGILRDAGYTDVDIDGLGAREAGEAVANAMIAFEKAIGFPTTLSEVDGFTDAHIERALTAAKNPQLKMKLQNMPVPLSAETVDEYMGPILEAARTGNLNLIRSMK